MEYVLDISTHDAIVKAAYRARGFDAEEAAHTARLCAMASRHGIRTHNAIKAIHLLDKHSGAGKEALTTCVPRAVIEKRATPFEACQRWNANDKIGTAVAFDAMQTAMDLAERYGVGIVSVDRMFHYLWGGGYVMEAARKGYIAYTNCTATKTEVIPYMGRHPTLGTNPHSWGFPTAAIVGFPIVIDWATSVIAMSRVQLQARDGRSLPEGAAVDEDGRPTTDPTRVAALVPFAEHKGYGLALINELMAALIGGSLPTLRGLARSNPDEKAVTTGFFQAIHPDAISCGAFAMGRDQAQNVKAVIEDILGHGNDACLLPGQIEAEAAQRSDAAGGLIFTDEEIDQLKRIADDAGVALDPSALTRVSDD